MTPFGLDRAVALVQCSWMHTHCPDSIVSAVWVGQTFLGWAAYLQGQSDLQGQPDAVAVVLVEHNLLGCNVQLPEQPDCAAVAH